MNKGAVDVFNIGLFDLSIYWSFPWIITSGKLCFQAGLIDGLTVGLSATLQKKKNAE